MKVFVCSRNQVSRKTSKLGITHVLSLLDPGKKPYLHPSTPNKNWLLLHFEDNLEAHQPNSPTKDHVKLILDWAKKLPNDAILLVHCEAGVSRSTAAAFAILVQHHGVDNIEDCASMLLDVRPEACPNPLITLWADEILECGGKLHAVAETIAKQKLLKFFQ